MPKSESIGWKVPTNNKEVQLSNKDGGRPFSIHSQYDNNLRLS